MKNIILIYIVTQLLSNAYGLGVIWSVRSSIEEKLRDEGYVQKNKNSLYKFNDKLEKTLKLFIPFYYAIKAVSLIQCKNPISKAVNDEIKSGNYITLQEQKELLNELNSPKVELVKEPKIEFEKPLKYKAIKNDISLYDTYETPIEYITKESTPEDNLDITPFMDNSHVITKTVKQEVTNKDIAKAISMLNSEELNLLNEKIMTLVKIKKENKILRYKDIA